MPNIINLRLLDNKNIIAELNGIPLAQENSYKIVAGEQNATKFAIKSKPSQYQDAVYTVKMINSQGYNVVVPNSSLYSDTEESIIENDEFTLPVGMAIAGYGWILISAYKNEEKIPFVGLKIKVWNTISNWDKFISSGGRLTNEQLQKLNAINIYGDGTKYLADDGTYKTVQGGGGTIVTIGGVAQETFDADTKVDKLTTNGRVKIYVVNADGTQGERELASSPLIASVGKIPCYFSVDSTTGNTEAVGCILTHTPTKPYQSANKNYVDNLPDFITLTAEEKAKWKASLGFDDWNEGTVTLENNEVVFTIPKTAKEFYFDGLIVNGNATFVLDMAIHRVSSIEHDMGYPIAYTTEEEDAVTVYYETGYTTTTTTYAIGHQFANADVTYLKIYYR